MCTAWYLKLKIHWVKGTLHNISPETRKKKHLILLIAAKYLRKVYSQTYVFAVSGSYLLRLDLYWEGRLQPVIMEMLTKFSHISDLNWSDPHPNPFFDYLLQKYTFLCLAWQQFGPKYYTVYLQRKFSRHISLHHWSYIIPYSNIFFWKKLWTTFTFKILTSICNIWKLFHNEEVWQM